MIIPHEFLYATTPTATARATANAKTPASPPFPITTLLLLAEELLAAALAFAVVEPVADVPAPALVLEVTVVCGEELPEVVAPVPFEAGAGAGAVAFPPTSYQPLLSQRGWGGLGKRGGGYHRRQIVRVVGQ